MNAVWYCTDCEREISSDDIDDHETRGHHVKGQLRPDRLLGNDPHNVTVLTDDTGDAEPATEKTDGEVTD